MTFLAFLALCLILSSSVAQVTEFISIDCGGVSNHTDPTTGLPWISDSHIMLSGKSMMVKNSNGNQVQYQRRRVFPANNQKYCYSMATKERRRYLIRATFQYGSLGNEDQYPKFELYLDATKWATIVILDASRVYSKEMIIRAPSSSIDVCLCGAITGSPFISTLELRPFNLSMYATDFEDDFFLEVTARVNFGASTEYAIRYPDDPYDRIWDSDLAKRQDLLVGTAPGTVRVRTSKDIIVGTREYPPMKVMQTAVVGREGAISYRLNLEGFPANARAYAYFAEIEELGENESRKFMLQRPYVPDYSNAVVNIAENANGSYKLYEPSYMNVSFDFVFSFSFAKTQDSARGPLLNAIEICRYLKIASKSENQDVIVVNGFRSMLARGDWPNEGGDPCVPLNWPWVSCTSSSSPPRITKIVLSGKKVKGEIPYQINNLEKLIELWLDGNYFFGSMPNLNNLVELKILHLENNNLTGLLPNYLGNLPNLEELDIQNNSFSGKIPSTLLTGRIRFKYERNPELHKVMESNMHFKIIMGFSIGGVAVILTLISIFSIFRNSQKRTSSQKVGLRGSSLRRSAETRTAYFVQKDRHHLKDEGAAYCIAFSELEEATRSFSEKIGAGSSGSVFHGETKDGKEVAVKIIADSPSVITQQFVVEVARLSRIHHRNLVPLVGYCKGDHGCILVYEYMNNRSLEEHLHGLLPSPKKLDWMVRLQIAEDAARGLEYLHVGCNPTIVHQDVKSSNILLDINMRAKVSDFGLSRLMNGDLTRLSSLACGSVGYLDPDFYVSHQLTEKSDVYSFGVVLLELISGRKPISTQDFGEDSNIIHWARAMVRMGDVINIMDSAIRGRAKMESVWRMAEVAIQCVDHRATSRPMMQQVISAIQEAIEIERRTFSFPNLCSSSSKGQPSRKTLLACFLEIESPDLSNSHCLPTAR